ncbi:MAG: tyrosine-type recombinase/integrase [Dehalococcoidia bacterium]
MARLRPSLPGKNWRTDAPDGGQCPLPAPAQAHQRDRRPRWAGALAPIPFHGLRHSMATMLLAQGLTLGEIQKVLGHA